MMNRSALNSIRGSIGMGQGNIRNTSTRSKDMNAQSTLGNQVTWDNPGLPQQSPVSTMPQGVVGGTSAPSPSSGLTQAGSFVSPQFQGGMQKPTANYGQQLNRFMGAGGNFNQFKPRMGAQGPQYRNGMSARPFTPPPPAYKPPDENIGLPPQPVESTSYVQPTFGGGY